MFNNHTPDKNDKHVQRLLDKLDSDIELIVLDIEPESGAMESDCTEIVRRKVEREGGRIIYGWQIWKSDILVEAEFHAVWETPEGELKDVTPKPPQFNQILFLEDETLTYEGKQIDNVRINITNNKLVDYFIEAWKKYYRLMNRGDRALLHGQEFIDSLNEKDIVEIENIKKIRDAIEFMLYQKATINDKCFCQSGKIYKNCHAIIHKEEFKKIK